MARRLKAIAVSAAGVSAEKARLGRIYLGSVDGQADTGAALPPDHVESSIRFDAPLEALDRPEPRIAEVPDAFVAAVDRALSPGDGEELLPPIYGDRHAQRKDVDPAGLARWLDELNLDPRTRLAARLGCDVIRKFQEELMDAAWQQVGDVIAANAQISRSRFLAAVATRMIERHYARLPPDRLLMLTSGLHRRTLLDGLTLPGRIAETSLPDRAFEPALRRLASPVGRAARIAARGIAGGRRVSVNPALCRDLAEALQRHPAIVDPDSGPRDGVGGFEAAAAPGGGLGQLRRQRRS